MENKLNGMLSPYRVLDLTDEKGFLCGKIMGDLGADVIKIEKPGGDPARNIGPFYHDEPDPQKSLFWFAFNTSKRGITLDIEKDSDQELFKKLVQTADFVVESFAPGYLDKLGLGYSAIERMNPRVIMVSITPFGQTGPYKDYKGPDIVASAMGGQMAALGDADRPPVHISHHSHAHLHASAEGVVGALMALYQREKTGEGQHIDVSIQESVCRLIADNVTTFDITKMMKKRGDPYRVGTEYPQQLPHLWRCKDGYVFFPFYFGGERGQRRSGPLIKYMADEGMADDFLKSIDFATKTIDQLTVEESKRIEKQVNAFLMARTKAEIFKNALKYDATLYPVATAADIPGNIQLEARDFWVKLDHPELGTSITYPGAFAATSDVPPRVSRRAPLIGEHNDEVFEELKSLEQGKNVLQEKPSESKNISTSKRKPLEGVKIVDFGWLIAGPLVTKTLADYGAEVILVEGKSRAGGWRTHPPFEPKGDISDLERNINYLSVNTSKHSIAVNMRVPGGKDFVKRLIARADIVSENYAGGAMERMGLGYEELKKIKPDIIMLSACMMGQTGPYANFGGDGNVLTALAGFTHITGWPDRDPVALGPYTDYIGPHYSLSAVLAALDYRRRTGKGLRIDVSQYETGVHFMSPLVLDWNINRRVANRMGNRSTFTVPHGVYRCAGNDKWCAIAVFSDEEWNSFCKVIGNPTWTLDDRFNTLTARMKNIEALDELINKWTIKHSAEDVMTMMQTSGIAAGIVQNADDLVNKDPQLKQRQYFWELDRAILGKHHCGRAPFTFSKASCELRPAPLLGEHNEYILKNILNLNDEEIVQLVIDGIIE
jgi:crotonobetainyl-CoA:carnitine CoA-transferase CaiB-like acyl-CoA transferase